MKTSKQLFLSALFIFLSCSIAMMLYSCDKDDPRPFYLFVDNPFPFEIRIIGHLKDCGFNGNGCVHYSGRIYEGETPGMGGNVFAYNVETGEQVGGTTWDDDMEGGYAWEVGYGVNSLVKIEDSDDGGSNGGGGGGCPGPQAMRYKDLMTNNPGSDCQQIWAQQAVWNAYKCNCDNGLATSSAANQMVATLNSIRKNIEDLYKSGGSGPYTKCGSIPATVSKCNVK